VTDPATAPARRWGLLNAFLAVLVLGLIAWAVAILAQGPDAVPDAIAPAHQPSATERQLLEYDQVKAAAREWTTDFLHVDYRSMDPIMKRVLAGTAPPFKGQYESSRENLKSLARINKSVSTGNVLQVGVSELEDGHATLYVAANSEVKNKNTDKPQTRYYRIELKMVRQGDNWLTSALTFVG
jgi:hypothetical protein